MTGIKWEYKVEDLRVSTGAVLLELTEKLSVFGKEGWELVSMEAPNISSSSRGTSQSRLVIFKRSVVVKKASVAKEMIKAASKPTALDVISTSVCDDGPEQDRDIEHRKNPPAWPIDR